MREADPAKMPDLAQWGGMKSFNEATGCPDMSGYYEIDGTTVAAFHSRDDNFFEEVKYSPTLTPLLWVKYLERVSSDEYYTRKDAIPLNKGMLIDQPNADGFDVYVDYGDPKYKIEIRHYSVNNGDYICQNGWITATWSSAGFSGHTYRSKSTIKITRLKDGFIFLHKHSVTNDTYFFVFSGISVLDEYSIYREINRESSAASTNIKSEKKRGKEQ